VNANFRVIYVRNDTDRSLKINQKNRLGKLIKIKEEQYYYINKNSYDLAVLNFFKPSSDYIRSPINNKDVTISHEIKVYKDSRPDTLDCIIIKYPNL